MLDSIVFCTARFPYGTTEQFIESEIDAWPPGTLEIAPASVSSSRRSVPGVRVLDEVTTRFGSVKRFDWRFLKPTMTSPLLLQEFRAQGLRMLSPGRLRAYALAVHLALRYKSALAGTLGRTRLQHGVSFYCYWLSWQALAVALLKEEYPRTKLVCRAHRGDLYEYASSISYLPLRAWIGNRCDHLYPVSDDGARYLKDHYGIDEGKITTHRLGVKDITERMDYSYFDKNQLHESTTLVSGPSSSAADLPAVDKENEIHVLSVSYLKPVKRVPLIGKMLIHVVKRRRTSKIKWTHIGGPLPSVELVESTQNAGLRARFLGQLTNADVLDFYTKNSVDLFINLSESEGVPVSIMEAMSLGIPILATDTGGVSEIVDRTVGTLLPVHFSEQQFYDSFEHALVTRRSSVRERWEAMCSADVNHRAFVDDATSVLIDKTEDIKP